MSGKTTKERICEIIDQKSQVFTKVSDDIWGYAETRFSLPKSADALCAALKTEGFSVQRGLGGMSDAFVAEYGSGKPVIGILGEYDALPTLNQKADIPHKEASETGKPGHGCGHNLLGAGALAAAVGIKDCMKEAGLTGTIRYFGCPAEESGSGKAFMARAGVFDGMDGILTWHPMTETTIWGTSSLANYQVYFTFNGVSSHAAAAPEMGRSALDAAELMNIGVNFLREHIVQEARIHYAYLDAGGEFPNVVQSTAKMLYFVRAPRSSQVREIFNRVLDVAEGAAKMTGTQMEMEFDSACSEYIVNERLAKAMYSNMERLGKIPFDREDMEYAKQFSDKLDEPSRVSFHNKIRKWFAGKDASAVEALCKLPIMDELVPYSLTDAAIPGSTDVGDASWQAPTVQLMTSCFPAGTVSHSWQFVACGKSPMAHKAMLYAGKVMAMTALDMLTEPSLLTQARQEYEQRLGSERYISAIPKQITPEA